MSLCRIFHICGQRSQTYEEGSFLCVPAFLRYSQQCEISSIVCIIVWNWLLGRILVISRPAPLEHTFVTTCLKPGVHTNDFAPIHRLRVLKLGQASLATVFRPGPLKLQPILRENLESPVLRYQPITTAVVTDACLNTRWHHGAYTSAVLRESLGLDRVVTVYVA